MQQNPVPRREAQPDGSVRVLFSAPILEHGEPKGFVTMRPPRAGEIWDFGDPLEFVVQDGASTPYVDRKTLRRWITLLMVDHDAEVIARENSTALGLLIEDVVLGFFLTARISLTATPAPLPTAA